MGKDWLAALARYSSRVAGGIPLLIAGMLGTRWVTIPVVVLGFLVETEPWRDRLEAWIARRQVKQRQERALRDGLRAIRDIVKTRPGGDPQFPAFRATAVLVVGEELVPKLRWCSHDTKIFDPKSHARFRRGDALAGMAWQDGVGQSDNFCAEEDFEGPNRHEEWVAQWSKYRAGNPDKWSMYMRRVRCVWTFPVVSGEIEPGVAAVVAVFCLDATMTDAFPETPTQPEQRLCAFDRTSFRVFTVQVVTSIVVHGLEAAGPGIPGHRHREDETNA